MSGLTINNNVGGHGPSTDGIDIDSSTNILVENCDVDCNDDNICIKAGRDADGLRVNRPTENVVVRNCIARKGAGLLTCGSETSGSIRNVLAHDLIAYGTGTTLRLKSSMNRGGTVENIYMTRVEADSVTHILSVDLNWNPKYSYSALPKEYEGKDDGAKRFISASGWNASHRIENFYLSNINAEVESVGKITYGKNFQLQDIHLTVKDKSRLRQTDNIDSKIEINYK